ncbi:MAG: hypothetical protein PHR52_09445 [Fermentimonas sp.]|nr:hypothetical protein [Dysgonamonadaceae bacterium]MDD4697745.1 hypothetical protein [Fermentimonas sp.]
MTNNRILFLYFPYVHGASLYSQFVWKDLLKCDFGTPLTKDNSQLLNYTNKNRQAYFEEHPTYLSSNVLTKDLSCPDLEFSDKVSLFSIDNPENQLEIKSIHDYDTIIIASFWAFYTYIHFVIDNFPKKKVFLIQDDSLQYIEMAHTELEWHICEAIRKADGYISYTQQMKNWVTLFQANVIHINHPVPKGMERIKQFKNTNNKICLGVGTWNYDLFHMMSSYQIFKKFADNKEYTSEILGVHGFKEEEYSLYKKNDNRVNIVSWAKGDDFYKRIGEYYCILNLNERAVAGRICLEAAIMGIPVIGYKTIDMQEHCWPKLCVEPYDTVKAISILEQLFNDKLYYKKVVDFAFERYSLLNASTNKIANKISEFIS